jgi:hypothetical protein
LPRGRAASRHGACFREIGAPPRTAVAEIHRSPIRRCTRSAPGEERRSSRAGGRTVPNPTQPDRMRGRRLSGQAAAAKRGGFVKYQVSA